MKKKIYLEPTVKTITVEIEKGFADSINTYANEGEAGNLEEGDTYYW